MPQFFFFLRAEAAFCAILFIASFYSGLVKALLRQNEEQKNEEQKSEIWKFRTCIRIHEHSGGTFMFEITRTVGSSHLDEKGEMRLSAAVDFMQDCCCFQLDSEKELTEYFHANHVTMFLISRQLNLIKPAYYGDRILIRTSIYQFRPSYGYRNTMIYNDKEELLVSSYAGGAFIDLDKGCSTAVPRHLMETVPMDAKFEGMEYLPRKIHLPKTPAERSFSPTPVFRYYLDHNQHMNNARYLDIAQEYLPAGFKTETCRIEYKTAAKYGDSLVPVRYEIQPGIWLISLQSEGGKDGEDRQIFANAEFRAKSASL